MDRPNPARWLAYAYGARLPARYHSWVLHDVTAPTWLLRHVARTLVQAAPFVLALYLVFDPLLDFPPSLVLPALGLGLLVSLYYSASFAPESADYRAARHGFPPGYATEVRAARRRGPDWP
ncbi:DUF5313 family protein [Crossiella sp. CA198]|uniref:DUF5313 family protein n=1 Tax=Crossiella sp. CA198 TaxID=3455607 RepID=UPI003F8D6798